MAEPASPLNFGPDWLLSSMSGGSSSRGSSTAAAASSGIGAFGLNMPSSSERCKYSKQQMLQYFRSNPKMPSALQKIPIIAREEVTTPLAFIPLSEQEKRDWLEKPINSAVSHATSPRGAGRGRMSWQERSASVDIGRGRGPPPEGTAAAGGRFRLDSDRDRERDRVVERAPERVERIERTTERTIERERSSDRIGSDRVSLDRNASLERTGSGERWIDRRRRTDEPSTSPGRQTTFEKQPSVTKGPRPYERRAGSSDDLNWRAPKAATSSLETWQERPDHDRGHVPEWSDAPVKGGAMLGGFDASGRFVADGDDGGLLGGLEDDDDQDLAAISSSAEEVLKEDPPHHPKSSVATNLFGSPDPVDDLDDPLAGVSESTTDDWPVTPVDAVPISQAQPTPPTSHTDSRHSPARSPDMPMNPTWYYKDPSDNQQGPFTSDEMMGWFSHGYFQPDLLVRRDVDRSFYPLGNLFEVSPQHQKLPFTTPFPSNWFSERQQPQPQPQPQPPQQQQAPPPQSPMQPVSPQVPQSPIQPSVWGAEPIQQQAFLQQNEPAAMQQMQMLQFLRQRQQEHIMQQQQQHHQQHHQQFPHSPQQQPPPQQHLFHQQAQQHQHQQQHAGMMHHDHFGGVDKNALIQEVQRLKLHVAGLQQQMATEPAQSYDQETQRRHTFQQIQVAIYHKERQLMQIMQMEMMRMQQGDGGPQPHVNGHAASHADESDGLDRQSASESPEHPHAPQSTQTWGQPSGGWPATTTSASAWPVADAGQGSQPLQQQVPQQQPPQPQQPPSPEPQPVNEQQTQQEQSQEQDDAGDQDGDSQQSSSKASRRKKRQQQREQREREQQQQQQQQAQQQKQHQHQQEEDSELPPVAKVATPKLSFLEIQAEAERVQQHEQRERQRAIEAQQRSERAAIQAQQAAQATAWTPGSSSASSQPSWTEATRTASSRKSFLEIQQEEEASRKAAKKSAPAPSVQQQPLTSPWGVPTPHSTWATVGGTSGGADSAAAAAAAASPSQEQAFWDMEDEPVAKAAPTKPVTTSYPALGKDQAASAGGKSAAKAAKPAPQQLQMTSNPAPDQAFVRWCEEQLRGAGTIDIPTFITFLQEIETASEVADYVQEYIGSSDKARQFAREFVKRRGLKQPNNGSPWMFQPAPTNEWQTVPGKKAGTGTVMGSQAKPQQEAQASAAGQKAAAGKRKKKGKFAPIDASKMLGFSVTQGNSINRGEIERPS